MPENHKYPSKGPIVRKQKKYVFGVDISNNAMDKTIIALFERKEDSMNIIATKTISPETPHSRMAEEIKKRKDELLEGIGYFEGDGGELISRTIIF